MYVGIDLVDEDEREKHWYSAEKYPTVAI